MKKKENRGGKRQGAGRPKTKEPTVVMRVPVSLVERVKELIKNSKNKNWLAETKALWDDHLRITKKKS